MTATTANQTSLTIDVDTDPEQLIGQRVVFTIAGAGNKPLTLAGRFETAKRMNLGGGQVGIGGMFVGEHRPKPGDSGRTSVFLPDGTIVFPTR